MLSSIHPLGERARGNRWGVTVTAFVLGAIGTGALSGATLAAVGNVLPFSTESRLAALAGFALLAALLDLLRIRPPGPERQVNERWIGQFRGWVYGAGFGAQLGAGFATFVVTWGVPLAFLAMLLSGSPAAGGLMGLAFGLGRSLLPLAAGWVDRPSRLGAFTTRLASLASPVRLGTIGSLALLALIPLALVWPL